MATIIPFTGLPTFKQGFDALMEAERIRTQKAASLMQLGSMFGDKEAIARGASLLGLEGMARKYSDSGEQMLSDSLKGEYINRMREKQPSGLIEKMNKDEFEKFLSGSDEERSKILKGKLSEEAIGSMSDQDLEKYKRYSEKAKELYLKAGGDDGDNSKVKKILNAAKWYEKEANKIKRKYVDEVASEEARKSGMSYRISKGIGELEKMDEGDFFERLPSHVALKERNIKKYIYSAPDESIGLQRLGKAIKRYVSSVGGVSPEDITKFQSIYEGLKRRYGQEVSPNEFRELYGALFGLKKGKGGKTDDYVVIDSKGNVVGQYVASNTVDAVRKAGNKKGYYGIKGDLNNLATLKEKAYDSLLRNRAMLSQYGIKVDTSFWSGEERLVWEEGNRFGKKEGSQVSQDEAFQIYLGLKSGEQELEGITQIKKSRSKGK